MPRVTRAELLEENEQLWTTVESIYDELGELLGLDATSLRSLSDAPIARPVSSGRALQNGGSGESQTTAPRRRTARARYPRQSHQPLHSSVANCRCRKKESAPLAEARASQRNRAPQARGYFT